MKTGRPSSRARPPFGQRLHDFRKEAGLTQAQVARALGTTPRAYAFWEREHVSVKPEQLCILADIYKTTADELIGRKATKKPSSPTTRKLEKVFQKARSLPPARQAVVAEFVEAYVTVKGK
jgi:transcriptional regulator with XRE-family HTH domain